MSNVAPPPATDAHALRRVVRLAFAKPRALLPRARLALLLVLAAMLPFELKEGFLRTGFVEITNLEAVLLLYLGVAFWTRRREWVRRGFGGFRWETYALLAWIGTAMLAAMLAPAEKALAFKFALRLSLGPLLLLAARHDLSGQNQRRNLARSLLGGALVASLLGVLESYRVADFSWFLRLFRAHLTSDQGALRLNGPFAHPNAAAAYLGVLLSPALAFACLPFVERKPTPRWGVFGTPGRALRAAILVTLAWALFLTLSRSGVAAGILGLLVTAFLLALPDRRALRDAVVMLTGSAIVIPALLTLGTASAVRSRVVGTSVDAHAARYRVDSLAALPRATRVAIPVRVENSGSTTWRRRGPQEFALAYHWADHTGRLIAFEGARTRLPHDVLPDTHLDLEADVWTPEAEGDYVLLWDMVQEHVCWFSQRGSPSARTFVRVYSPQAAGAGDPSTELDRRRLPDRSAIPATPRELPEWKNYDTVPRRTLWNSALALIRARPWCGVGPGRFGDSYPRTLPPGDYDPALSAHSLYLETATCNGLPSLAAFLVFISAIVARLWRRARGLEGEARARAAAGLGLLAAFGAHGLLDCFLNSQPVMSAFWLMLAWVTSDEEPRA